MCVLSILLKDEYLFLCKDIIDCFHGVWDFLFVCFFVDCLGLGGLNPVRYLICLQEERELEPWNSGALKPRMITT